ncbi:LPS-assembly protein LptD [Flammeovirga pectinis]|uniref:LPS-assembly protein LptD n=1 Tax=Flammeovirga pectinis TaxID=2494373 RepID=A0A3Q9FLP5_9BACT|nr:putative LPS assembly protein LptD [Flammeovirga pectinis]AZQ62508.1 LPS-assembly protein LptD [Flammeovirga pectinis]
MQNLLYSVIAFLFLSMFTSNAVKADTNLKGEIAYFKIENDTAQSRQAARQLTKTLRLLNSSAKNELLTNYADALHAFSDSILFRGDRDLQQIRVDMSDPEIVGRMNQLNSALKSDDPAEWEEAKKSGVFDDLDDIMMDYSDYDLPSEDVIETLDMWKTGEDISAPVDQFDSPVKYTSDWSNFEMRTQTMYMKENAEVEFGEQTLKAGDIQMNFVTKIVKAQGIEDSTGTIIEKPIFKDGESTFNANEMIYNYETGKGLIKGIVTEESDGIITSQVVKKTAGPEMYMGDNVYTTCRLEHPHFGFRTKKLKVVPEKNIVSGPFLVELNESPLPLGFFFGIFPATTDNTSGFIMPSYGESTDRGFYLRDGGVFLALTDYFNLTVLGTAYTLGGWGLNVSSQYRKRYAFSGNTRFSFVNNLFQENDGTLTVRKDYQIQWSHSQESKKNSRFSANVNIANSDYNRNNSQDANDYLQSSMNSSVSYSNSFNLGNVNVSTTAQTRYQQNVQTGEATLTPEASLNMQRVRPFQNLFKKSNLISEIGLTYSVKANGSVTNKPGSGKLPFPNVYGADNSVDDGIDPETGKYPDLLANFGDYQDDFRWGVTHDIPISTQMKVLKYFTFSPSFNYKEYWHPVSYDYTYLESENAVKVDTTNAMTRYSEYSTAIGFNTNMFMFYNMKGGSIIRHTIQPSASMSFRPDFGDPNYDYYQMVQTSNTNPQGTNVFRSEGGLVGKPSAGRSSNLSFAVNNVLELKSGKKGEDGKATKTMLLNNLNVSSGYDFERDSLNWSDVSAGFRTTLLKKIDVSVSSRWDPYRYVVTDTKYDETLKKEVVTSQYKSQYTLNETGGGLANLSNMTVSLGTRLAPKGAKDKKEKKLNELEPRNELERQMLEEMRRNPDLYMDFDIPWSLSVNYNLNYNKTGEMESTFTQTLTFSGDLSLTPKWKFAFRSGYDFKEAAFSYTSFDITRDLHCWQLTANWIPFGPRQSYNITIAVKAAMLQDLKWERRNSWIDRNDRFQ